MRKFTILYFILSCIAVSKLSAQWIRTNGPTGGSIKCFSLYQDSLNNKTIFAGSYNGGIFTSTDLGESWNQVRDNLISTLTFNSIVSNDKYVFAINDNDCFRSSDVGKTWKKLSKGKGMSFFETLTVKDDKLLAGTFSGIFISTDNGDNWLPLNDEFKGEVYSIAVNDSVILVASERCVKYSKDNGYSWKISDTFKEYSPVTSIINHGKYFFCIMNGDGYRSADNGETWIESDSIVNAWYDGFGLVNSVTSDGKNLYAAASFGIFISTDNGVSWNRTSPQTRRFYSTSVLVTGSLVLAGTDKVGIYRSTDYGASWVLSNDGMVCPFIDVLSGDDSCLFAGIEYYRTYRSSDKGENWKQLSLGYARNRTTSMIVLGDTIVKSYYGSSIEYSPDYGNTWPPYPGGLPPNTMVSSLIYYNGSFYAGTDGGVFYQESLGKPWIAINSGLTALQVTSLLKDGQNLYASTRGGEGVYWSTDNGWNWTGWNSGLIDANTSMLCKVGPEIFISTAKGLCCNNGSGWVALYPEFSDVKCLYAKDNYLFASKTTGLWMTSDYGKNWTDINSGLPGHYVKSMTIIGEDMYAGTYGGGIFRRPLSEMIKYQSDVLIRNKPIIYLLNQNHPNPFNPTTTISYTIPKQSYVELKVYDMLGREVSTPVSKEQGAGEYKVQFDGSALPSGVYIYTIQAGEFRDSKKLMLVK